MFQFRGRHLVTPNHSLAWNQYSRRCQTSNSLWQNRHSRVGAHLCQSDVGRALASAPRTATPSRLAARTHREAGPCTPTEASPRQTSSQTVPIAEVPRISLVRTHARSSGHNDSRHTRSHVTISGHRTMALLQESTVIVLARPSSNTDVAGHGGTMQSRRTRSLYP